MRRFILLLPLLLSFAATAATDNDAELQRLYHALDMLKQEQQTIYQQFQMVQELGRGNAISIYGIQTNPMQPPGEIQNYADVIEAQRRIIRRGEDLNRQADQLYTKYNEIEEKKKPLQQRILELSTSR